jgi:hypothetical protein
MLGSMEARTVRVRAAARATWIWLGAVAAGLLMSSATPGVLALVAALGTLACMTRRPWTFVFPLGVAALLDAEALPWAIAAAAITWRSSTPVAPPRLDSEPQLQLMRSRRRNEPASVVVMRAPRTGPRPEAALWCALRATDGSEVLTDESRLELRAVLEDRDLDRSAFEERMRAALGTEQLDFGWAVFPADGVTLDVLVEAARSDLAPAARTITAGEEQEPAPIAVPATAIAKGS